MNSVYTLQICSYCSGKGHRNGDKFKCQCGVGVNANHNASRNVLNHKYDKEISIYNPYKRVKKIILSIIPTLVRSDTNHVCSPLNQARLEIPIQ